MDIIPYTQALPTFSRSSVVSDTADAQRALPQGLLRLLLATIASSERGQRSHLVTPGLIALSEGTIRSQLEVPLPAELSLMHCGSVWQSASLAVPQLQYNASR